LDGVSETTRLILVEEDLFVQDGIAFAGGHLSVHVSMAPYRQDGNEDSVGIIPLNQNSGVLVVADGAGGQPGGERASRVAVREIARSISSLDPNQENLRAAVLDAIEKANQEIMTPVRGAGTTLEVLEVSGRTVRTYHIGDSSTLVVGGRGKIHYQTTPHSPVGYAVEAGLVEESEALFHEDLHLVSNLLGTPDMKVEVGPVLSLAPRDTIMLASDGVTDNLQLKEIAEVVRRRPLKRARESLASLAQDRMLNPVSDQPSKQDDLSFLLYRPG